jgi:uncharacterized RmlC-like cupin family protein
MTNPIGRILNGLGQRLRGFLLIPMAPWRHESIDDAAPTCRVVGAGAEFIGKQGHLCAPGISAQSVGARRIHLQTVRLPPGGRSTAHKHDGHETAIHILSGKSGMWYGERLEQHLFARAGDFLYIPADTPHLPYNPSDSESCVAVIARTDPNDQESVVLLPELDRAHGLESAATALSAR